MTSESVYGIASNDLPTKIIGEEKVVGRYGLSGEARTGGMLHMIENGEGSIRIINYR